MAARELVVLGTASQAPTRTRHHNGCFLRWDAEGLLLDPGEAAQRQLLRAGIASSAIDRVAITHFHGDHCLGLPGVLQRRCLDEAPGVLDVHYPASGQEYFDRLHGASIYWERAEVRGRPVTGDGEVARTPAYALHARRLEHSVDAVGYRLQEPDGVRMLPDLLAQRGVAGPDVRRLMADGALRVRGELVRLEDVSAPRPGQVFAWVMDTRLCDGALELARGADLLVCEATFLHRDAATAWECGHLTARQAAELAVEAGARRLVLTHFSQRYPETVEHLAEASAVHPDVVVARELQRIPVPARAVSC